MALDDAQVAATIRDGIAAAERARVAGEGARTLAWLTDTDDGRRVCVYTMMFDNARLCIGPTSWAVYDAGYCYDGTARAIFAAAMWLANGATGEPDGWKKNLQTGEWKESA